MSDIHTKLAAVAGAIGPINKDEYNKDQGFAYRSIEQITERVRPLLAGQGVSVAPKMLTLDHAEVVSKHGTRGWRTVVVMQYTFGAGTDDSTVEVSMPGEAVDYGDKSTSKAVQMAYKYALIQALQIGSGGDPDGQTVEVADVVRPQTPSQAPAAPAAVPDATDDEWKELYAISSTWPSREETMKALEARLRRLHELMERCAVWKGGSLHAALRFHNQKEHVSDLRKEELFTFADRSWKAAQEQLLKPEEAT